MNSMEEQINMRLNSLHYKYYIDHNHLVENITVNKGHSKLGFPDKKNDAMLYVHGIDNFDSFKKNKINSYLISSVDSSYYDFFIGDEFASILGVSLNDTIKMYYPSDINIVFNEIPYINHIVTGIFDTDFLNYDSNTILASLNSFNNSNDANYKYYFDSEDPSILNIDYKYNSYLDGIIINALNLEKKLYYVFGLFVIVIACFMFF
jgi:ABC-type lipoprotein release transport system permease subunit